MGLLLIVTSDHSMLYVKTLHVQVQWFLCIQKQCFSSRKIGKACQAKLASALRNLKHVPATEVCGCFCIQIMIFFLDDDKHGHACAANETFISSIYMCVSFCQFNVIISDSWKHKNACELQTNKALKPCKCCCHIMDK